MAKNLAVLSAKERERLYNLVSRMHDALGNMLTLAQEVYREQLWREHATFRKWMQSEFGYLTNRRIAQIEEHIETVAILPAANAPTSERVTRPMTGLSNQAKKAVWADATAANPNPTPQEVSLLAGMHDDSPPQEVPAPKIMGVEDARELVAMIRKAKLRGKALGEELAWLDGPALFKLLSRAERCVRLAIPEDVCDECDGAGCDACGDVGGHRATERDGTPATPNQRAVLAKRGQDVGGLSKKEASRRLDNLSIRENWGQLPPCPTASAGAAAELAENPPDGSDLAF